MARFASNEVLFHAVNDLVAALEREGHRDSAARLRSGFGCLNGLTDGWALFLESIDGVFADDAERFGAAERQALDRIRAAVRSAVHRRG